MFDIYAEVTSRIVAQLDQGVIPWKKPWTGTPDGAVSHAKLRPYSLINQMLLGTPGEYFTLKQCNAEGGRVRKGAKSHFVVFWKAYTRQQRAEDGSPITDDDGNALMRTVPVLRYYRVFNISDCEGVTPRLKSPDDLPTISPVQRAEDVFAGYRARSGVKFELLKQNKAFDSPAYDKIVLPLLNQFSAAEEYYSTLFHESVHSTGHVTRLNRFDGQGSATFGSETYSKEELVAEIGAAAILHELHRGVTELHAHGMYPGEERALLMCVISKHELPDFERILRGYSDTFAYMSPVNKVMGYFPGHPGRDQKH